MVAPPVSFLTPYWSGAEMMRIHLASIRRFHPDAPILVSKRDGGAAEMAACRRQFGIECWLEDCGYTNAYLRLLARCGTRYACIADHDTVLLSSRDGGLAASSARRKRARGTSISITASASGWRGIITYGRTTLAGTASATC